MFCLRRRLAALLIGVAAQALLMPAFGQTCSCPPAAVLTSGPIIQAPEPPPPLPVYEQPPMPASGYHWTPGYWAWNNVEYYWVPGVWVQPPQVGVLWTPPYWAFVGGVFGFHAGYWAPHVGFYGGVNYGFGYEGLGYQGGHWQNNQFYYNSAVNNFGNIHVGNTYNAPVTINKTVTNNVSYNGGTGGLQVRPTPEQEQVAAQPHISPTQAQLSHVRTASVNPEQFHTENQGKPAVAATQRPGELKGPGVFPAKAAGTAAAPAASAIGEPKSPLGAKPPAGAPNPEPKPPQGATLTPNSEQKPAGAPSELQKLKPVEKPSEPGQPRSSAEKLGAPAQMAPVEEKAVKPAALPKVETNPSQAPAAASAKPKTEPVRPETGPKAGSKAPEAGPKPGPKAPAPGEAGAADRKPKRPEGKACGKPGEAACK